MSSDGRLYIFEGPDGVGKSALSQLFANHLKESGVQCDYFSFPGQDSGTLGNLVYRIHHNSHEYGINSISQTSLQIMHVAAHIDAIENHIIPALKNGRTVVLDRFWWSTQVYASIAGVGATILEAILKTEMIAWGDVQPSMIFLIRRTHPLKDISTKQWRQYCEFYEKLAMEQTKFSRIHLIDNNGPIRKTINSLLKTINENSCNPPYNSYLSYSQLPLSFENTPKPYVYSSLFSAKPTIVYDTYWRFASERQAIFFKRLTNASLPWTNDPILKKYKFTNAYRASDRVSQFLIKNVIYKGDQSLPEVFFRIVLFKLFNKIETWQLLTENLGYVRYEDYSFKHYDKILTTAISKNQTIYSAAYIMPSGSESFGNSRKHRNHLQLLERMMEDELFYRIADTKTMFEAFKLLRSYPMIGDFLAYQYLTDLNYSNIITFSEMDFVIPGPGARAGIHKCFESLGGLNESDIIKVVTERQQEEFERRGLTFQSLWGRSLQLIDCQNLFCEVDKYSRIKHPEVSGISGRMRIKQKFILNPSPIDYWYPPKWGLNEKITSQ